MEGRSRLPVTILRSLQHPTFFMHHPVVWPTEECQVGQRIRAAPGPPDEVMPVAPIEWPRTAREDTMPVACLEGAASRRRQRPGGVVELVLELGLAGDPADRAVARIPLPRPLRYRTAALALAGGRAL